MERLIKASMLLMVAALFAACANEDIAQDKKKENGTEAPKGGVVFATNDTKISAKRRFIDEDEFARVKTRTNIKHTPGQGAEAYWTSDDFIWVKKQDGTWAKSTAITLHDGGASAEFTLPGSKTDYADGCEVRYTGTKAYYSGTLRAYSVFIPYQQSRTVANDFSKAGEWGDCGSGKAHNTGNPTKFNFTLEHKSAYLCFLPRCTNAALASNIQLKGIKITATNSMSGGFIGDQCGFDGDNVSSSGGSPFGQDYINVTLPGFPLSTTENQAANATYLVVPPDTYDFRIEYTIKDPTTNVETVVTDIRTGITLDKGNIYDVTANLIPKAGGGLSPKDYRYYMWDAQQHYWSGYESYQPVINNTQGQNWPQSKATASQRWCNDGNSGTYASPTRYDAQTSLFKTYPNRNENIWYVMKGDAHWGNNAVVDNGHLRAINGVWLRKKSAIVRYLIANEGYPSSFSENDLKEGYKTSVWAAPIDYRNISGSLFKKTGISQGNPSNITDYFFLPAAGFYNQGWLLFFNEVGRYWTSSAYPGGGGDYALSLYFKQNEIGTENLARGLGFSAGVFE